MKTMTKTMVSGIQMQEPFHHYGLSVEQLQQLLDSCLKPEEISGASDIQHDRIHELVWWFSRLTQGNANSKWAIRHAFELAYFVAINGVNNSIDLKAIRDAAFKEGVNITAEERSTLERIGFAIPIIHPLEVLGDADTLIADLVMLWDSQHVSPEDYNEAMCAIEIRMRNRVAITGKVK